MLLRKQLFPVAESRVLPSSNVKSFREKEREGERTFRSNTARNVFTEMELKILLLAEFTMVIVVRLSTTGDTSQSFWNAKAWNCWRIHDCGNVISCISSQILSYFGAVPNSAEVEFKTMTWHVKCDIFFQGARTRPLVKTRQIMNRNLQCRGSTGVAQYQIELSVFLDLKQRRILIGYRLWEPIICLQTFVLFSGTVIWNQRTQGLVLLHWCFVHSVSLSN